MIPTYGVILSPRDNRAQTENNALRELFEIFNSFVIRYMDCFNYIHVFL